MTRLPHEIIRASAGSGKTYQLTLRFIRLLALGVAPDHIVALTFTRKAAGEFFARILTRLAEASGSEEKATSLSAALDVGVTLGSAEFRRLLRQVVAGMHRLRLGTLDGFFAQILRSFPWEFGLAGDFTVPSAELAALDRQRVFGRLFEPGEELSEAQRDFFAAFKQATWGHEDFRLADLLDDFIRQRHEWLLAAPFEAQWGGAEAVWGADGPPQALSPQALAEAIETVRAAVAAAKPTSKQQDRWDTWFAGLASLAPGAAGEKPCAYFTERLAQWRPPAAVALDRRTYDFTPAQQRAFISLVEHPVALELAAAQQRTRGVWRLLSQYEAAHHQLVRRAGRLSFADVQALLAGATPAQRAAADEPPLENLAFADRLDGRFDHWLLDEFQDTSLLQWRILHPLVREALMDPEGGRTYFHVGDVKQAIYAWREGEARLTERIVSHYGGALRLTSLAESYRSAPPVLEAVNRVCGAVSVLHGLFGTTAPAAVERWRGVWEKHTSAGKAAAFSGHAALVRPVAAEPEPGQRPIHAEFAAIAALLARIDPLRRGLTCAILVPKNEQAREAAAHLARETPFPAVTDAKRSIATDNAPCRALMHLLQAMAHPGDTLAWEAVRMTPLRPHLERPVTEVAWDFLAQLQAQGFGVTLGTWAERVRQAVPELDAFNRLRLTQFTELAAQFDDEGGADIDEFLAYASGAQVRGGDSAARAIQCMTIHGAKGLEFDVVILAGLEGDSFDGAEAEWLRQRTEELEPAWYLRVGKKLLAEAEPKLAAALRAMREEEVYEALCTTYVAMTRAKRGLYLVSAEPKATTTRRNAAVWIERALVGEGVPSQLDCAGMVLDAAWQTGDPEWFRGAAAGVAEPAPEDELPRFPAPTAPGSNRGNPRRPSGGGRTWGTSAARQHGSLVHAMLSRVVDPADESSLLAWFREHCPEPDAGETAALAEVRRCLTSLAVREVMGAPGCGVQVWQEKAFEAIVDGEWTSGVFDRVVVGPDWARLVEFKTSPCTAEAARAAASQLEDYRRAVAHVTGLDLSRVSARFVFTHDATVS